MENKTWKWSDLVTDAQGKLDEKRVLCFVFAVAALVHVFIFRDVALFGAMAGASAAFITGAIVGDQGK